MKDTNCETLFHIVFFHSLVNSPLLFPWHFILGHFSQEENPHETADEIVYEVVLESSRTVIVVTALVK
jgi:hypothetical protein